MVVYFRKAAWRSNRIGISSCGRCPISRMNAVVAYGATPMKPIARRSLQTDWGLAAFTKTDAEIIPGSSNRPRDACAGVLAADPTALHRVPSSPKRESPVWVKRYSVGVHRKPLNVGFAPKAPELPRRREM